MSQPFESPTPPDDRGWPGVGVVLATALAPVGGILFSMIPFPGLDYEDLLRWVVWTGVIWSAPLALLVFLRWIAAARPDARAICAMTLLVGAGLAGGFQAVRLSGLRLGLDSLVDRPGWGFVLFAALTVAGVHAVLWLLADAVDRSERIAGGPLVWFGFMFPAAVSGWVATGSAVARADPVVWTTWLGPLAWVLPLIWLTGLSGLTGLANTGGWPVRVIGEWRIRSRLEAALTLWAVGGVVGELAAVVSPEARELGRIVATALGVVALQQMMGSEAGGGRRWAPGAAVAAGAVVCLVLASLTAGFVAGGGLSRLGPGPFSGDGDFRVTLSSDDGSAERDAPALEQRLAQLRVDARVRATGPRTIEVALQGVGNPNELLQEALRGGAIRISREVTLARAPDLPDGVTFDGSFVASDAESLARVRPPPGLRVAVTCPTPDPCVGHLVGEAVITGADLVGASVGWDQLQEPFVLLTFSREGGERFEAVTADMVGERLVIEVDEEVLSVPKVMEAIPGGRVHLTPGQPQGVTWCQGVAAALSHPLTGRWWIEVIDGR